MIQKTLVASAISLVMLTACSDNNSSNLADPAEGEVNNGDSDNPDLVADQRSLEKLDNSEAFFSALRDGLVQQNSNLGGRDVAFAVDEQDAATTTTDSIDDSGAADTSAPAGVGSGSNAELAISNSDSNETGAPVAPGADVTTTNVQEVGVDEQDRMKSDGEFLYILDNQYDYAFTPVDEFSVTGEPVPAPPAENANVDTVSLEIEVLPVEADVPPSQPQPDDGGAAVSDIAYYEPPDIKTTVRILSLQPDAPDATPVTELEVNLGGGQADGMYLYKTDDKRSLILTSTSFNNFRESWNDSYAFGQTRSVVTKLDVTNPSQSSVENTFQIDGQIISSRRIGNNLFLASRYYPVVPGIDPYSMTPEEYQVALEAVDLNDVLPTMTQTGDGTVTPLVDPAGCFVAAKPETSDYYYTPDIVSLAVINLDTLQLQDSECFLGATETIYATPNSVFLATTRWDYSDFQHLDIEDNVTSTTYVDPRVDTDIHQFSINGAQLTYSGSGVVDGHLGWNPTRKPFRMSERNGYLRVATFSETQNESVSPINVSVLKLEGDGELVKVAQLPNDNNPEHIGKPGEQLYASRYLGDRGYLVTFRQTDPLYVIDFANPEDPKLAGELEIDGYSDYLQPIGENHLLGIGKDAVASENNDRFDGGLTQGVKLSLFNVADANNPFEVQSLVIGERGTEAVALSNHRAITVQRATDTHPTRIAFGIDVAGLADPRPNGDPTIWYPWNFTGLHGFDITTGDGAGIEKRGVMVVNSASNPVSSPFANYGNDRSVIVGDSVYYIHGSDVFAANWFNLSNFVGPR